MFGTFFLHFPENKISPETTVQDFISGRASTDPDWNGPGQLVQLIITPQ